MHCRFCHTSLSDVFIDLFNSPPSNSFLTREQLQEPEEYFPLKVFTCPNCRLVQVDEFKKSDAIFDDSYVYFSSYSSSWLKHAKNYTGVMIDRFAFSSKSKVVEIASNDGYLLQYFAERGVPVLGIEPTANTAAVAQGKGIETVVDFFGTRLATDLRSKGVRADLLLGNNVLAHVPDIVDFTKAMKILLSDRGIITMEFPHLMQLVGNNQFDTIYHEHFSYLSFGTVNEIFRTAGLRMFDVEELATHGGSLRIYACNEEDTDRETLDSVTTMLRREDEAGMRTMSYYRGFGEKALHIKTEFLRFLLDQRRDGKKVAAYGAAAKGNTLLNYCGIKPDLIDFVVDANPHKQGKYLPGSHIPVVNEERLRENQPDYIIIFPWNIKEEVMQQLNYVRDWGGLFVVAIPQLTIF